MNVYECLIILLILTYLICLYKNKSKESFDEDDSYYVNSKTYDEIYDDFYSFFYDDIFYQEEYYVSLCKIFLNHMNHVYNNHLCIGIKHGGHINELLKKNMTTKSVSKSKSLINVCKYKYKDNDYQYVGNYEKNPYAFDANTFTHISVIDNEIYYLSSLNDLFYNINKWLIFKGYLMIPFYHHKQDFEKGFLKVGDNSNIRIKNIYSAQFKDFSTMNYTMLYETINDQDKVRKNNHTLYFYKPEYIEMLAKEYQFQLLNTYKLSEFESVFIYQNMGE